MVGSLRFFLGSSVFWENVSLGFNFKSFSWLIFLMLIYYLHLVWFLFVVEVIFILW